MRSGLRADSEAVNCVRCHPANALARLSFPGFPHAAVPACPPFVAVDAAKRLQFKTLRRPIALGLTNSLPRTDLISL